MCSLAVPVDYKTWSVENQQETAPEATSATLVM